MKVVEINLNALNLHAHEAEALGGQTIARVQVALVPLLANKTSPVIVGDSVEAITKGNASRGRSTVRMVVSRIDVGMIVEVLLHVNNIILLGGKNGSNEVGVGCLVTRNFVVVDDSRKSSDVVGKEVEVSSGLSHGETTKSEGGGKEPTGHGAD
jgi:hypothetical protein